MPSNSPPKYRAERRLVRAVSVGTAAIILGSWLALSGYGLNDAGARGNHVTFAGGTSCAERPERNSAKLRNQSNALDTSHRFGVAAANRGIGTAGADPFAFLAAMVNGNIENLIHVMNTAAANDVSWINPNGGNWNTASNWHDGVGLNRVPTSADNAIIDLAGTYIVTLDVNATVASLILGAPSGSQTLTNTSRMLTLSGESTI